MSKVFVFVCLISFWGVVHANYDTEFTGDYSVANWTQSLEGGVIDLSNAPYSITLFSKDFGIFRTVDTDFTIVSRKNSFVSFAWNYETLDSYGPLLDPFGWLLNGVFTQLTDDNGSDLQSGVLSLSVVTGDEFGFRAQSADSRLGSGITTISNFSVSPVSEPSSVVLLALGLLSLGLVRKAQFIKA